MTTTSSSPPLYFTPHVLPSRTSNNVGILTLNRPSSLNSLTLDMVRAVNSVLATWHKDPSVLAVLVEGVPRRRTTTTRNKTTGTTLLVAATPCFCAGGDVKAVVTEDDGTDGSGYGTRGSLAADFFREEYTMNHALATHKAVVPQISLWDGVVMGGGVGISVHGAYRVATENTLFAMPETAIGFFPDVGASYWLSRLQEEGLGTFLALTGWRLRGDDVTYVGIATHYVESERLPEFRERLLQITSKEDVQGLLDEFHTTTHTKEPCFLAKNMAEINSFFGGTPTPPTVQDILANLSKSDTTFATTVLTHLRKMSPTSLVVTLEALRRAATMDDIGEVLSMEFRMSQGFVRPNNSDFHEGVRALLVEKGRTPNWSPKRVDEVVGVEERFFKEGVLTEELVFKPSPSKL